MNRKGPPPPQQLMPSGSRAVVQQLSGSLVRKILGYPKFIWEAPIFFCPSQPLANKHRTRSSSCCCRHRGDWSGQHPRLGRQTDSSSLPAAAGASAQPSHVRSLIHLPGHHWINVLRPVAWTHTIYHMYNYICWTVVVRARCGGAEDAWLFLITRQGSQSVSLLDFSLG